MPPRRQARPAGCDRDGEDDDFAELRREHAEVRRDNDDLRRQVEVLTQRMDEVLQRQYDDVSIVDENPFAALPNRSPNRPNNCWEQGFRVEIPPFDGTLKPEEFVDWLSQVEEILDFKEVPVNHRVSLVTIRLHGRAQASWQQLKQTRARQGKEKVSDWNKFRKHIRAAFLPYNFDRELYQRFQNLRQGPRIVEEYSAEFYSLLARVDSNESPLQLVSRYIGGLRLQFQDVLNMFDSVNVAEAHQQASQVEKQFSRRNTPSFRQPASIPSGSAPASHPAREATPPFHNSASTQQAA
ncbi:unnamed protein product [Linum trigynum]|uniref:Retrotransposon gag domain-containing protein n=1 Tax=Linum trigynum TaxID=586398 RepID=A0AAV2G9F4_9ROSI